jgi:hypothetical protein
MRCASVLHQQVIEICAVNLDTERAVTVESLLGAFELNVYSGIGNGAIIDNLDMAVGSVGLAIGSLVDEYAAFLKALLESDHRFVSEVVTSSTMRQVIKFGHSPLQMRWAG